MNFWFNYSLSHVFNYVALCINFQIGLVWIVVGGGKLIGNDVFLNIVNIITEQFSFATVVVQASLMN